MELKLFSRKSETLPVNLIYFLVHDIMKILDM